MAGRWAACRTLRREAGLHARPGARIVAAAQRFQAELTLEVDGRKANLSSLIAVLALGVSPNSQVIVRASGADAEEAADVLEALLAAADL